MALDALTDPLFHSMDCSLWNRTIKVVFLMAITSSQKVSELQTLYCKELHDQAVLPTQAKSLFYIPPALGHGAAENPCKTETWVSYGTIRSHYWVNLASLTMVKVGRVVLQS